MRGKAFLFGSVYFRESEGLSQCNRAILAFVVKCVFSLGEPWILGGDWPHVPADIVSAPVCHQFGARSMCPSEAPVQPSARVIDYCLVAADVHASMRHCKVVHGINVKPHMLVSCEVSAEAANASIEVAGGPRPFPKSLAYGPCARPGAQ